MYIAGIPIRIQNLLRTAPGGVAYAIGPDARLNPSRMNPPQRVGGTDWPLQHVVIVSCRQFVSNILFRLGQENGWAKIWDPKKRYFFFCPHMFLPKQDRSRLPSHYRAMTTARTTFLSSALPTSCDLRTVAFIEPPGESHHQEGADRRLRCNALFVASVGR